MTIWVPVFFGGRGDLGRTPTFTQTDLLIGHTILLTERVKLRFDANVINLFNQAALTNVNASLNRNGNVLMPNDQFLTGFDAKPGTLEARLVPRGRELLTAYAAEAGIPLQRTGALLVAWNERQREAFPGIVERALMRAWILTTNRAPSR